jgi:hypothetical protein
MEYKKGNLEACLENKSYKISSHKLSEVAHVLTEELLKIN